MGLLARFHFWPLSGQRRPWEPTRLPTKEPVEELALGKAMFLPGFFRKVEAGLSSPEALKEPALQRQRSIVASYANRGNDDDWPIVLQLILGQYMAEVECLRDKAVPPLPKDAASQILGAYWNLRQALYALHL